MSTLKLSSLTLALMACSSSLAWAGQADSKGFIEDSHLSLVNRSIYFNRQVRGDGHDGESRDPRDWLYGLIATYGSGFTQGTIGFGFDAFAHLGLKLDGGDGHAGTGDLQVDNNGEVQDDYSKIGGAVKLQISNTVLKYGEMQPTSPVFAAGGSRLIPQTATGFSLFSQEIENLDLDAGHFTAGTEPTSTSSDGGIWATYANEETSSVDYLGGAYRVNENLSVSLYGSEFEDIWRQYYANTNYVLPLQDDQSLTFDFNIYRTTDEGRAEAGSISNTTWSLAGAYMIGAHTFTLAHQRIHGDTPFDYVGFGNNGSGGSGDSIFLANSIQWSDFNGPNEKSWQGRYDLDMTAYGMPGLSFMTRYVYGYDIDGTHADSGGSYVGNYGRDDKERETNLEARYVIQDSSAKDLSLRIRQAWHRGDDSTGGAINEFRFIVDYPLEIL
ncbi:imipenem/basic amino acid-specific outer membrane pore [Pseudomonas duriflava]|uniref:Imipenem/basic amino acid-specific outer membrane pore n=1 Tax=Pseudomonas duriflava TaxID=459528 RepID=A0A562QPP0_9PSED|nr:OprD family porin [Pseudomonas duriflava]TWI58665.1 imipenem/basic amino acid-specific outer membrane pore [Pseudomonas duriflava]